MQIPKDKMRKSKGSAPEYDVPRVQAAVCQQIDTIIMERQS